jgi:2,4-dienoyl-CoA reductase-like NADH-dependent reductase (Old Yellow Enzyme family)
MPTVNHLQQPLELPCGAVLKNRIAKSAMTENLASNDNSPNETLIQLYKRWVNGGAGLIITGNIMVDSKALGEPANVVVEDERNIYLLKKWADVANGTGTHFWPQLNHPGRQAPGNINKEIVGPSAIGLQNNKFIFKTPRALKEKEILEIIEKFGNAALVCKKAGFTGVQIHGAHGYLISQFLSPIANQRKDDWGGSLKNRARFVIAVYENIRAKVGKDFPVGIKINSADFQRGGFTEEESMEVVHTLSGLGMDLIEISGGSYEQPAMMGSKQSTQAREAYFMEYIEKVRKIIKQPLMLTGGFRTVELMNNAIADGHLDVVGLARPFSMYPEIANEILNGSVTKIYVPSPRTGIKMIDQMGFIDILWHELQMERIGKLKEPDPTIKAIAAIGRMVKQNVFHH